MDGIQLPQGYRASLRRQFNLSQSMIASYTLSLPEVSMQKISLIHELISADLRTSCTKRPQLFLTTPTQKSLK